MDLELVLAQHGFSRISSSHTFEDSSNRWLAISTHQRDFEKQKSRLDWLLDHIRDRKLTALDDDFLFSLAHKRMLESSGPTSNRYMSLLRTILRLSKDWGWIHSVPKIHFFPESEPRVRWLQPGEASKLLQELPPHLADMALFTLATGLRQSNVTNLKWPSVDMSKKVAIVSSSESKTRKAFSVPLNSVALGVLVSRLPSVNEFVFNYHGSPVTRCSTAAWYKAIQRAGISDFRWHDLRHTWASWHVQSGTSLYELQNLGGWKTIDMVTRYAHLSGDHLITASERIEQKMNYVKL